MSGPTFLQDAFDFVPPPFPLRDPGYPAPKTFLHFPDTHLDENLILKRICILPSLVEDILHAVDTLFPETSRADYNDGMFYFSQASYADIERRYKASDVGAAYAEGFASVCCQVASAVIVHPVDRDNGRLIGWDHNPYQHVDHDTYFYDENIILGLMNFPEKELRKFSAESRERLRDLGERFPVFALGMFLSPSAQWCLEDIDALVPSEATTERTSEFPWLVNSAPAGHAPTPSVVRPADTDTPLWHFPKSAPAVTSAVRTSKRSRQAVPAAAPPGSAPTSKHPPPKHFKPKDIHAASPQGAAGPKDLLQRAWVKAVRFDVTVILFDCGNFSSYGKLMIGLHLCIFQDIFARRPVLDAPVAEQPQSGASGSNKRSADHVSRESSPKRGRTTEGISQRARRPSTTSRASRIQDRINQPKESRQGTKHPPKDLRVRTHGYFETHPVLAVYLQYGYYNSPTPQVLLAPDHPRSKMYKAATCLPIILTSKLGRGATGKAYTAVLGPGYDNLPCSCLVVKLADTKESLKSLRHEYDVYCHLQSSGVHGIPYVFGYYQDSTRGLGALVLHDVGNPLGRRMDSNKRIKFSSPERSSLKRILKAIHSKGVLHRDLRSWNMMCNQHGEVSIIDFDRASLKASKEEFSKELARLTRFLDGEFVDEEAVIGSHDIPSTSRSRDLNESDPGLTRDP
ncbi:hypothetical protein BDZ89DRAFT_1171107 [Hymenopellis radicata]|nr:hypothetical protein BDZ89DRAFT_1171107 [Hymenopellis radicata]